VRKSLGIIALLVFTVAVVHALRLEVLWPRLGSVDAAAASS
jgi:hypothetical protein